MNSSTSDSVTIYDHSNASLASGSTQTSTTLNFGNLLQGATVGSQSFSIYNNAVNTTAANTANLALTSASGATGPFSSNLTTFSGLVAGASPNTYSVSLSAGTLGSYSQTLNLTNLVDDSTLSGHGTNNNGTLSVVLQAVVGSATADHSGSADTFGPALSASVANGGSLANLSSTVTSTGNGELGTVATILAGTTDDTVGATTVSMSWRTRTGGELGHLLSDVVNLSGIDGHLSSGGNYVLEMKYDTAILGSGASSLAPGGGIYLASRPDGTSPWENAVLGNSNAGTVGLSLYEGNVAWNSSFNVLGEWGVDTSTGVVWAVLDHNSQFAVVPEPGSMALLLIGLVGVAAVLRRRGLRAVA